MVMVLLLGPVLVDVDREEDVTFNPLSVGCLRDRPFTFPTSYLHETAREDPPWTWDLHGVPCLEAPNDLDGEEQA